VPRCEEHDRHNCWDQRCRRRARDNAGNLGIDVGDGDLVVGLGGGLGIDTATGDLELEVAPGVYLDLEN
jgi:hypothetical protein